MKVSLIMTVYNMADYLKQAVDSVIAQTYGNFELIIVDDGSTDSSVEMVDSYAELDSRIRVIHKKNGGLSDSRNVALDMVTGDYIGFIDSDDWYEPNFLESLVNYIEKENLDIAICGIIFDYKDKQRPWTGVDTPTIFNREEALCEILIDKRIKSYVWNKLFKRELITEKMPVSYVYEDYATVFKWFINANRTGVLNVPLYHYRQRNNSIIHERNLTHIYNFFVAERDRAKYVIEHKIVSGMTEWLRTKLITTAIGTTKDIARFAPCYDDYLKFRNTIANDAREFLPCGNLSFKKRYRLWLLLHNPRLYYINMIVSYWFQKKKKHKLYD